MIQGNETKIGRMKKRSRSALARIHIVVIDIVEVVVGKINFYVIRKGNKSVYNKEYTTKISNEPNHTHAYAYSLLNGSKTSADLKHHICCVYQASQDR